MIHLRSNISQHTDTTTTKETVALVTVGIPCWNSIDTVLIAIESILTQTYQNLEVLVVDDASTDGSADAVASVADSRVRLIRKEVRAGAAACRNTVLTYARGDFICWLDADDVSHRERIMLQLRELQRDPKVVIAGAWVALELDVDALQRAASLPHLYKSSQKYPATDAKIRVRQCFQNQFSTSAVMIRMSSVRRAGFRFEDCLWPAEDFQFWTKVLEVGQAITVPKVLAFESGSGYSKTLDASLKQRKAVNLIVSKSLSARGLTNRQLLALLKIFNVYPNFESGRAKFSYRLLMSGMISFVRGYEQHGINYQFEAFKYLLAEILRFWWRRLSKMKNTKIWA